MSAQPAARGMDLLARCSQYRHRLMDGARRLLTERELLHLHTKIDSLLDALEGGEGELAAGQEDECVICVHAAATMQTWPCGHRVVCRRCFVKTIQAAVSQRLLPLRCVVCRAKVLRLRRSAPPAQPPARLVSSRSWQGAAPATTARRLPASTSCYSVDARRLPPSASLYSVTSGESSWSAASSASSGSGAGAARSGRGLAPRPAAPAASVSLLRRVRRPLSAAPACAAASQSHLTIPHEPEPPAAARLPPIREFQREFREGQRERSAAGGRRAEDPATAPTSRALSASSRGRRANNVVTQLESTPHAAREAAPAAAAGGAGRAAARREEKRLAEERRRAEAAAAAERKREEKARQKAEKEARRLAQEQERQARQRARDEERRARQLAKQRAKQAGKDAKQTRLQAGAARA